MAIRFLQTKTSGSGPLLPLLPWRFVQTYSSSSHIISLRALHIPSASPSHKKTTSLHIRPLIFKRFIMYEGLPKVEPRRPIQFTSKPSLRVEHRYTLVQNILHDEYVLESYLNFLETVHITKANIDIVGTNFRNALEIASQYPTPEVKSLLFNTWYQVFLRSGSKQDTFKIIQLKKELLLNKDRFIHFMMNEREYNSYEKLILPLLSSENSSIEKSYADILAQTMRLDTDSVGRLIFDRERMILYLKKSSVSLPDKRRFLDIFARKGLLHSSDIDDSYCIIRSFFDLLRFVGDEHLDFTTPKYNVYKTSLQLIAELPSGIEIEEHVTKLKQIIESLYDSFRYRNFLTSTMSALIIPSLTLHYWEHKYRLHRLLEGESDVLNYKDLKYGMNALRKQKKYEDVLKLYKNFPTLHHDDQIEILLQVSEEFKDWKLLQQQFEEMYGRGQLPFVNHYAIVMNGIASIGAREQIEKLYHQLMKRKIKPTPAIFAALINSNVFHDDEEKATYWFNQYQQNVQDEQNNASLAYLYSLLFKLKFKSTNVNGALSLFTSALDIQDRTGSQLIDSDLVAQLIKYLNDNYALRDIEHIFKLAKERDMDSKEVYIALTQAYIRFEEFERAEWAVHEGQSVSDVPFRGSDIYTLQLRNYRHWYKASLDPNMKDFVHEKAWQIVYLAEKHEMSRKYLAGLYSELIRFHIRSDFDKALEVLDEVKKQKILEEGHFIPFLSHYSKLDNFEGYHQIMDSYREMASLRLKITTLTYYYLIQSLIHFDKIRGERSSFKLLSSIFELNGLTIDETDKPSASDSNFKNEAPNLCRIVCRFVLSDVKNLYMSNSQLVNHFLDQLKVKLGSNLPINLRIAIYQEMSRLYVSQGNLALAERLIDSGLNDIEKILRTYVEDHPFSQKELIVIPFGLQKPYRDLVKFKFICIGHNSEGPANYLTVYNNSNMSNVRLTGEQYRIIIKNILLLPNEELIPIVLDICEKYLVRGSMIERNLHKHLQYMYKLILTYASRHDNHEFLSKSFDIFSRFYDADINVLRNRWPGGDIRAFINRKLDEFNHTWHRRGWTLEKVMNSPIRFFNPEQSIYSSNKLDSGLANRILKEVKRYCRGNKMRAFELMDDFPDTMDFLLYDQISRFRYRLFRKEIDKIISPPDTKENLKDRAMRTFEALSIAKDDPNIR